MELFRGGTVPGAPRVELFKGKDVPEWSCSIVKIVQARGVPWWSCSKPEAVPGLRCSRVELFQAGDVSGFARAKHF